MIDSAGDLLEPVARIFGKIVGWTLRLLGEVLLEALPDIFGGIFNFYAGPMERRGWSAWLYVPLTFLLTLATMIAPVAVCIVGPLFFLGRY